MSIEQTILNGLTFNEDFTRKALPFLKPEYFNDKNEKTVFEVISSYINKYNSIPGRDALLIDLETRTDLIEDTYSGSKSIIDTLSKEDSDLQWMLDHTEKFCQEKAFLNAIKASILVVKEPEKVSSVIPMFQDALSVSFDSHIGHDFMEDYEARFDFYHQKVRRIPFSGLENFNKITKGGLPEKTLNMILAATNVGKSLVMCHCAADQLALGYNVLYITLEMSEESIAQRIDSNLLNVPLSQIESIPRDLYINKVLKLRSRTKGRLIIKEYPTAGAGPANFRALINEIKIKKNFIPDIIYIDYLNICTSSRLKMAPQISSYTYMKSVAEELRGLAVEFKLPIVSATQTNRNGFNNTDVEMTDISESAAVAHTVDFMFALISTEEMREKGQYMVKQLKSRYGNPAINNKFMIGVDKDHMRLYDLDEQDVNINEVIDLETGEITDARQKPSMKEFNKQFFSDFK